MALVSGLDRWTSEDRVVKDLAGKERAGLAEEGIRCDAIGCAVRRLTATACSSLG